MKSLLIVEDDESLKVVWNAIVKQLNFPCAVTWVSSITHAQEEIKKTHHNESFFDLIVSDIFLAEGELGLDLIQELKDCPTEFLFTSALPKDKYAALTDNLDKVPLFLTKPLDPRFAITLLNALILRKYG